MLDHSSQLFSDTAREISNFKETIVLFVAYTHSITLLLDGAKCSRADCDIIDSVS